MSDFEKLFPNDRLSKRERVVRTLNHQSVDRAVLHEQLGYNGRVIAHYTGKPIQGFDYTPDDVGVTIRKTLDTCFPFGPTAGTDTVETPDGFVFKNDNWTRWRVSRPFVDERGAAEWIKRKIEAMVKTGLNEHVALDQDNDDFQSQRKADAARAREKYRSYMLNMQRKIGETVIIAFSGTGFCNLFDAMGLEIYTFFSLDYPDLLKEYVEISLQNELNRVHAAADCDLSPVILIPEDFATKQGPIFNPQFLGEYHYPYVKKLTEAWHEHDIKVIYHSDGNYRKAIPDLINCGVDGFYCLEPNCGMDIVELKKQWPAMVWAGGVDGVDLMEKGTPAQVKEEVRRHIESTNALQEGGMFVATSSEINPTISLENFMAMVEAVGENYNRKFLS